MGCAEAGQEACVVEVPVYDAFGSRLDFRVTRVSPQHKSDVNLLKEAPKLIGSRGHRILFYDHSIITRAFEVTLEGPKGARVTTEMIVMDCPMRRSLFYGQSDIGHDVWGVRVAGRLSGCHFAGDWWVRALPMFGGHGGVHAVDGTVKSDGTLSLVVGAYGVRHILVIGKDKQPIKVIGFDVTIGKESNIGVVDLGGHCPEQ